jgi:Ca2+/H+ antiporter
LRDRLTGQALNNLMTAKQSTARLCLYAGIAFVTPIAANWNQMESASAFQWGGMLIQAAVTALIAIRAYVDTSPIQIDKQP